jgi:hypothetical protein
MYLLISIFLCGLATVFYVPHFLDIPFGAMTARMLFSQLVFAAAVFGALATFARSIEVERIWPWNRSRILGSRPPD